MIKKTDIPLRAIQFIIFVTLLCTAIAGSICQAKGKNTAEVQSALLNPKYTAAVTQIQLQQESNNFRLTLKRSEEGFWTGTLRVLQSASAAAESTASAVTDTPAMPDNTPTVPAVPAAPGTPAPGADLIFPADTLKIQNLLFGVCILFQTIFGAIFYRTKRFRLHFQAKQALCIRKKTFPSCILRRHIAPVLCIRHKVHRYTG